MSRKNPKQWPTYLTEWVGKFAIRIGPEFLHRRPQVVYISHITKHGYLTGQVLNKPEMLLTKPCNLTDYTPRIYDQLYHQSLLREARKTASHQMAQLRKRKQ